MTMLYLVALIYWKYLTEHQTVTQDVRRNVRRQRQYASGDAMLCRCSVAKDGTIGEKRLSLVWLFSVISCRAFFIRFWVGKQYEPRTTGPIIFASLQANLISLLCLNDFWLRVGKMDLARKEGVGTGNKYHHIKYVKKLISRQTQGYFSTLALIQTFNFINLLISHPYFLVLSLPI